MKIKAGQGGTANDKKGGDLTLSAGASKAAGGSGAGGNIIINGGDTDTATKGGSVTINAGKNTSTNKHGLLLLLISM